MMSATKPGFTGSSRVAARFFHRTRLLLGSRWYVGLCACAALSGGAGVTQASIAPLPPLPAYMPLDDTLAPTPASYDAPTVARAVSAEVPNPFRDDANDDSGASRIATPSNGSAVDDGTFAAAEGSVPLRKRSADEAREDATGSSALEGPPVPLPPPARLSGAPRTPADAHLAADDKPISLNFQRAELGAVLKAFGEFTGLNLVASEKVRGTVSLRLDKVPWRAAFDTLLDVNNLAMERHGNVIWVAPQAELASRERQRFEAHARAADLEPLASRTFQLRARRGRTASAERLRHAASAVQTGRGDRGSAN